MKISGVSSAMRVGGLIAAVAIGAAACGSSKSTTSSQPSPTPSASSTATPTPSLPPGCHGGIAGDVASTVTILTDPAECPGSVNAYWKQQLGELWTEPTFIPYDDGDIPANECGERAGATAADFEQNAFYCPADGTIAYSRQLLNTLYAMGGPYPPVVVLVHEVGQRANDIAGTVGVISRSEENEADCDAGVTTAFARTAGRLPLRDVIAAAKQLYEFGDTRNFGDEIADSPNAHGTPAQRAIAFGRGYLQKISACRTLGESPDGSVSGIGF